MPGGMPIGDLVAFRARVLSSLRSGEKRISYVLGSGITAPEVPGVSALTSAMRASLEDDDQRRAFDETVQVADAALRYQAAAEFVFLYLGPDRLNRIIRRSVLEACAGLSGREADAVCTDDAQLERVELEKDWRLTRSVRALGKILAATPPSRRGVVLTTNFDPLLEVAIRQAGATPRTQALDEDGRLLPIDSGVIDVVHVHGFWRTSDTLHMQYQLAQDRPMLEDTLRTLLAGQTIVVAGYGGWKDVFTRHLVARVKARSFDGTDIIWGAFAEEHTLDLNSGLFAELFPSNRVTLYGGIDGNSVFPYISGTYSSGLVTTENKDVLPGWTTLTTNFLASHIAAPNTEDRNKYFDGLEPSWTIALDAAVRKLSATEKLVSAIRRAVDAPVLRIVIATGPMGEGKSTGMRQAAVHLTNGIDADALQVLWREPTGGLEPEHLSMMPEKGIRYVLFLEEADLLTVSASRFIRAATDMGRSDITLVLSAQERDFRIVRGFEMFSRSAEFVFYSGLTKADAHAIASSWAQGDSRENLEKFSSVDSLADFLLESANSSQSNAGSLIGAMLAARYGDFLEARVEDLLERLKKYDTHADTTLKDAFSLIVIIGSYGTPNSGGALPVSILARATKLDPDSVHYLVILPLGKEALTTRHAGMVRTRHPMIATTSLRVLRRTNRDLVIRSIFTLTHSAVLESGEGGIFGKAHHDIAYMCQRMDQADEAIASIDGAIAAAPKRLTFRTSKIQTLRRFGLAQESYDYASSCYREIDRFSDQESRAGFFSDWAVSAGSLARYTVNLLLDAMALTALGYLEPGRVDSSTEDHAQRALLGSAVALTYLHKQTKDSKYSTAAAAVVFMVDRMSPKGEQVRFLETHRLYVERVSATEPVDLRDAVSMFRRSIPPIENFSTEFEAWDLDQSLPILYRIFDVDR